jgi:hypothetical protein
MFIGHYAVGFAAKKLAPKTSLGTLLIAAVWMDILFSIYLLLGLEHFRIAPGFPNKLLTYDFYDFSLSHSLGLTLAWAAVFGLVYLIRENDLKVSGILAGLVAIHWGLDYIVHKPDLSLLPVDPSTYSQKFGLSLWNSIPETIAVEGALFIGGILLYLRATKAIDEVGKKGFWVLVGVITVLYVLNFIVTPTDKPQLMALTGIAQLLLVAWGYWVDDHRKAV